MLNAKEVDHYLIKIVLAPVKCNRKALQNLEGNLMSLLLQRQRQVSPALPQWLRPLGAQKLLHMGQSVQELLASLGSPGLTDLSVSILSLLVCIALPFYALRTCLSGVNLLAWTKKGITFSVGFLLPTLVHVCNNI